jgi:hypothetical protein
MVARSPSRPLGVDVEASSDLRALGGFFGYTQSVPNLAQLVQGVSRSHFFFRLLHVVQALTGQLQHQQGTKWRGTYPATPGPIPWGPASCASEAALAGRRLWTAASMSLAIEGVMSQ